VLPTPKSPKEVRHAALVESHSLLRLLVSFLALLTVAGPAQAFTIYQFGAEGIGDQDATFTFRYVDYDGNGKVSYNEYIWSSLQPSSCNWSGIIAVPVYDDVISPLTFGGVRDGDGMPSWWPEWGAIFGVYRADRSTYTQVAVGEVVPLPPSVFLLGAGLIGLAAARRKKRLG
jgi:hypothetical protein